MTTPYGTLWKYALGSCVFGVFTFACAQAASNAYGRNDLSGFGPAILLLGGGSITLGVLLGGRPRVLLATLGSLLLGNMAALVVWMFTLKAGGPSNLWPIEIVVDAFLDAAPVTVGGLLGFLVSLVPHGGMNRHLE